MPFANHKDTTAIYYETFGEGTPIMFIHPPAMGHVTFKRQRPLARNFKLIFIDLRGNGRSDHQGEKITMNLIAEDLLAVIDTIGLEKVVLCGYSNGGSIAQHFAITYPERTAGLILCGGFSEVNSFLLRNEFRIGIFAARLKLIKLMSLVLATAHAQTKVFEKELEQYVKKSDPNVISDMYNEGLHYKSTDILHKLKAPLLLIYGGDDDYVHHYKDIFLNHVKTNVKLVFIDGAPHQLPTKHYNELNSIITKFVCMTVTQKEQI